MSFRKRLALSLEKALRGEVRSDHISQKIYSVDASIFEVEPTIVVLPKCKEDLLAIVEIAREFETPIIPRGGATGIAGGCLGEGIVVDMSKYLNRILDLNLDEKWVLCEPGVVQDQLNAFLATHGYRLGPETSAGNRATIGGMTATNATGSHFLHFGNMVDHVLEVEMILSTGKILRLNESTDLQIKAPPHSGYLGIKRSSSGYPLYILNEQPRNLAKLTVGSEGTLGLFSEIKLRLSRNIQTSSLVLFFFDSLEECLEYVPHALTYKPISLEIIDHHIIEMGRLHPNIDLDWLEGNPKAILFAEFETHTPPQISSKQKVFISHQEKIWALRKAGLGLLLSRRSYSRAIAFIEDLTVPPDSLAPFVRDLKTLVGREMGIYGHAGDGCLHFRPYVDIRESSEIDWLFQTMKEVAELVRRYGGMMSGEHGDGLIRSWLNPKFFEGAEYETMRAIKKTFDPFNLMNPGKVIGGKEPRASFKKSTPRDIETFLDFKKEGGLYLAADLCNGNGACRKKTSLMCPSFHAFGDERHTTRARAQSFRAALNGKIPLDDPELLDVLDYCLECKGCKTECPSQVDMAKMKMELLFQYQEKHGYPLLNRLFGQLSKYAKLSSQFFGSSLSNWMAQRKTFLSLLGIASERTLPSLAKERFSSLVKKRQNKVVDGPPVRLFIDTFTEYFSPEIGMGALELLELQGYRVEVLPHICCGRTLLSKGMLKEAKIEAEKVAKMLDQGKGPVLILEPSCLSAILDDYPSLHEKIEAQIEPIETFLPMIEEPVFIHPHCHDQALKRTERLLMRFPQATVSQAGCCGMAGSFGYEKRHYSMSMAIAESRLLPHLRNHLDLPILASGFSCRQQIIHGAKCTPLHPVEYALQILRNS